MSELLIPIETENETELVFTAEQNVRSDEDGSCPLDGSDCSYEKTFCESAVHLGASRPRTQVLWPMFRFIKETHVWLVWIPLLVIGLGIGMNLLAVTMNHGTMPVVVPPSGTITKDKMHVAATANSRVLLLCDWIQLYAIGAMASPGDFLIRAGDFLKWPLVWMWVGLNGARFRCRKLSRVLGNA